MKIWDSKNILGMVISIWECEFVVDEAASEQAFGKPVNAPPGVAYGLNLYGTPDALRREREGVRWHPPPRTHVRLVVLALCPAHADTLKICVPYTVRNGFQICRGFAEANATRQIGDNRTHQHLVARVTRHVPQHAQKVIHGILTVSGSGGGLSDGEHLGDGLEVSGHGLFPSMCVPLYTYIIPHW